MPIGNEMFQGFSEHFRDQQTTSAVRQWVNTQKERQPKAEVGTYMELEEIWIRKSAKL